MLFLTVQDRYKLMVLVGSAMTINATVSPGAACDPERAYLSSIGCVGVLLFLSLCWNIFFLVSRCRSGNTISQTKKKRPSSQQMEENPIYGNISYTQTSIESDAPHSSTQPRFNPESRVVYKQNAQECYANLTLKAPRVQSGRSSPQIQYSDIVLVGDPPESEKEDEGCAEEGASIMSDLYASVQTQRVKTIDPEGEGEGYANHL